MHGLTKKNHPNFCEVCCTCVQCLITSFTKDGSNLAVCPLYQFKPLSAVHDIQIDIGFHPRYCTLVSRYFLQDKRPKRESN
jgi:hypothetical protein